MRNPCFVRLTDPIHVPRPVVVAVAFCGAIVVLGLAAIVVGTFWPYVDDENVILACFEISLCLFVLLAVVAAVLNLRSTGSLQARAFLLIFVLTGFAALTIVNEVYAMRTETRYGDVPWGFVIEVFLLFIVTVACLWVFKKKDDVKRSYPRDKVPRDAQTTTLSRPWVSATRVPSIFAMHVPSLERNVLASGSSDDILVVAPMAPAAASSWCC
jgi:hypothetical protein